MDPVVKPRGDTVDFTNPHNNTCSHLIVYLTPIMDKKYMVY
ncbi:hypothetical protein [Rickettsia monacensis]|nr:hypothetical protein [Rickettsia monacensis]